MKKFDIINIVVLLALFMAPNVLADGANSLVQLDLKRASDEAVNVTLFTSNSYGDNVMVRKKSDNKYVILIPKVQSSGYSASNLNGVRDLISNVDVKTVNDTNGGYTKVTLITTKPIDIKTSTRKSQPQTAEQKEYQTLIAQANSVKNNISKDAPPKIREQKTEITVNKAPQTPVKKSETKQEVKKPEIKLTEVDTERLQRQARQEHLAEMINDAQLEKSVPKEVPSVSDVSPVETEQELTEVPKAEKVSVFAKLKHKSKQIPKKPIAYTLAVLFLINMFKNRARNANLQQNSIVENSSEVQLPSKSDKYDNIIKNGELSWKEKYQMYLASSATPVSRGKNKGNYLFIKTPDVDKKREELEKLIIETSAVNESVEPEIVENEDSVIQSTIKFKAFGGRSKSLSVTNRGSRFKKYEVEIPLHEQKTVELGDSLLHTNPRKFAGANLDSADVGKKQLRYKPYIMSSVDEYFSILENETQPKVVEQSAKMTNTSNPITKHKEETKSSYLSGLIVKSGFNIDDKKGFYLVNQNGQNALVGKVNDEVFVLKKFDKNVTAPIQVRHDNANVYMVKAGSFKSLVEVNEDKMGVLIEL